MRHDKKDNWKIDFWVLNLDIRFGQKSNLKKFLLKSLSLYIVNHQLKTRLC